MPMSRLFLHLFRLNKKHPVLFYTVLLAVLVYCIAGISRLTWNNDIFSIFPQQSTQRNYETQINNLRSNNNILILLHADTPSDTSLALLLESGEWWEDYIKNSNYLRANLLSDRVRLNDSIQRVMYDSIYANLPLLLAPQQLDSIAGQLTAEGLNDIISRNARMNRGFAGAGMRYFNNLDPLHLVPSVLQRLQSFKTVPKLKQVNGFQVSTDEQSILFDIQAVYGDNEDPRYEGLRDTLLSMQAASNEKFNPVRTYLIGAPIASEINKDRSFKDGTMTGVIAGLLTIGILYYFYRRLRLSFLSLIPSIIGYSFSLATFGFLGIPIVAMAMSSATIILAMGINYSIHLISARMHEDSIEKAIKSIANPLLTGNITTIAAFAMLALSDSLLLRQFSYLAVISLGVGVLTTLIILPIWLSGEKTRERPVQIKWFEKATVYAFHRKKWLMAIIIFGTLAMIIPSSNIKFEGDLSKLNYIPPHEQKGIDVIEQDLGFDLSRTQLQVTGTNMDEALIRYDDARTLLLKEDTLGLIPDIVAIFPPSNLQYTNNSYWRSFWSDSMKMVMSQNLANLTPGREKQAVENFVNRLSAFDTTAVPERLSGVLKDNVVNRFLKLKDDGSVTITVPVIGDWNLERLQTDAYNLYNRQHFANQTAGMLQSDFNDILAKSAFVVFFLLWIVFGRIEIATLSFIPMAISWIWILGIAHLLGIQIHIVNLILCTFIFGLCDDYSIFMIDGLTKQYATGQDALRKDKKVIIVSVLVTMISLAALLLGKHPAFHSFAILALIGLFVVLVLSMTLQPALYHFFITSRTSKGNAPVTLLSFIVTVVSFGLFILLGLVFSILGIILYLTGLMRVPAIKWLFHKIIQLGVTLVIWSAPYIRGQRKDIHHIDFNNPGVIIANHQTHLDLLFLLSLHPKMVVVTNSWVYNNPVYGGLVRTAGYLPGFEGQEVLLRKAQKAIDDGYSILVFPEGTRSKDGQIKRFYKGAFLLAESLQVPIYPVVIHGLKNALTKGDQHIKPGKVTLKALPAIAYGDRSWGASYSERSKSVNHLMRVTYDELSDTIETPDYNFESLLKNYLYKGPIVYWYAKLKMINENLYRDLDSIIPRDAIITDLGCGMGMTAIMLKMSGRHRQVTGVDYDEEKVAIAANSYLSVSHGVKFIHADITTWPLDYSDVFIMYDSLHYLTREEQVKLIDRCARHLRANGMIIIREGVENGNSARHKRTKWTEWLSTKVMGFNKTKQDLVFVEQSMIYALAEAHNLEVETMNVSDITSNVLYVLRKK